MRGLATLVWIVAGIAMWLFEIVWFAEWWDIIGVLVAVFIPPLAAAFPFIYVVKEGFDQGAALYFGIWGFALVVLFLAAVTSQE